MFRSSTRVRGLTGSGFTILETLIAIAVLLTGLVVTAGLFSYATTTLHRAEGRSIASMVVFRKIEELKLAFPASLAEGGSLDGTAPLPGYSERLMTQGNRVSPPTVSPTGDLQLVWQIRGRNPARIAAAVYSVSHLERGFREPLAYATTTLAATL